jgi:hypothetical protein
MSRKLLVSVSIMVLSLLGELFLWNKIAIFSLFLIALAYIKHILYPIKKELFWYLLICVAGTIVEIVLVNFGHGWTYSNPDVFGIPLWIPLFWGLVGTTIIIVYQAFNEKG